LDALIAIFFSIELCLRFYVSNSVWEFFTNCFNIIDILAVLPNYVEWVLMLWHLEVHNMHQAADSMRALRMTRIIRLVRLARMARVARVVKEWNALSQMELLLKVFVEETAHGSGATSLMLLSLISLTFACMMYLLDEPSCQSADDASSWMMSDLNVPMDPCEDTFAFNSLPSAWWWALETLTTVGFGDVTTTSISGKFLSAFCCLCGVAFLSHFSAQFSMHFCQRWLRLQATHQMKEQIDDGVPLQQFSASKELEHLDDLLLGFEESLTELVDQVTLAVVAGPKDSSPLMVALSRSVEAQGHILNSAMCAFLHEALTPAMSLIKCQPEEDEESGESGRSESSELLRSREAGQTLDHPNSLPLAQDTAPIVEFDQDEDHADEQEPTAPE